MLRLFFNRNAPLVYLANFLALILLGVLLYRSWWQGKVALGWGTYLMAFGFLFFNGINLINWYPQYGRTSARLGIRLHFQKTVVPVAYLSLAGFLWKFLGGSEGVLLGVSLLYLPMYYVAFILLFFHFRDSSELMPGYFSHNFYLKDETQ